MTNDVSVPAGTVVDIVDHQPVIGGGVAGG
jgi:hypothetical protein